MAQKPQLRYTELRSEFLRLERSLRRDDNMLSSCELPDTQCDADSGQLRDELAKTMLVLIGRNGVGKTVLLERMVLISQALSVIEGKLEQPEPSRFEDSEACIEALKGRTWGTAVRNGLTHVPYASSDAPGEDDIQQCILTDLRKYASGVLPSPFSPRFFLIAAGRKTNTTTSSITEAKYGRIPGAIEYFKSAEDLQIDAYNCLSELMDKDSPLSVERRSNLWERWSAITGQEVLPAALGLSIDVPLRQELQAVIGTTRLFVGHDQPWIKFAAFLRRELTGNQSDSVLHVALERTILFVPSTALSVPIVDTPGTADANSLNADLTQQAVEEAIENSSQLLLCGGKSFAAEATLEPYVIQYFTHMITSKSGRPAIKGILMPGPDLYLPEHLQAPILKKDDAEREEISMQQLRKWIILANRKLPANAQATEQQLEELLQRCEVKVVYMQLYASLCLQPPMQLDDIANENEVTPNELLASTNGPWLMGLPRQLLAETTQPFMEGLASEHLEQLLQRVKGRLGASSMFHFSSEESAAVAAQIGKIVRKPRQALELHLANMRSECKDPIKALSRDTHSLFKQLAGELKQKYVDREAAVQDCFEGLYNKASPSDRLHLFSKVTRLGTNRSKAFKTFFSEIQLEQPAAFSNALQDKVNVLEEHVLHLITSHAEECAQASTLGNIDLNPLIQQAAAQAIKPSLNKMCSRLHHNLVRQGSLNACLRHLHVEQIRAHLATGPLSGSSSAVCQIRQRVHDTVVALEQSADAMFRQHIDTLLQHFEVSLTRLKSEHRFRGQLDILMGHVLHHVGDLAKAVCQVEGLEHLRQAHETAEKLQHKVLKEAALLLQSAQMTTGEEGDLVYSVHRRAKLNEDIWSKIEEAKALEAISAISAPKTILFTDYANSADISQKWQDIGSLPMQLTSLPGIPEQAPAGFCIPALPKSYWSSPPCASLPNALQHLLWPDAEEHAQKQQYHMVRLVMAQQVLDDWRDMQQVPALQKHLLQRLLQPGSSVRPGMEEYATHILSSSQLEGIELVLLMKFLWQVQASKAELCFQTWLGCRASPVVLFHPLEDSQSGETSACPAYSLLQVVLPRSKISVWLPLVKQSTGPNAADASAVWRKQLSALDEKLATESAAAQRPAAVVTPQQQPKARLLKQSKLPRYPTRQSHPRPAESSASVTGKRGPSPEGGAASSKARRV